MEINKKLIVILVNVLLFLSIVFCTTVAMQVTKKGYVTIAGHSMFRVVTGSMEPTMPIGSLLISQETEIEKIAQGDIVCFHTKEKAIYGEIVTHRVVGKMYGQDGTLFLETRGDANAVTDGHLVSAENLIGKVIWYSGGKNIISKIASILTTGQGFFSLVLMPILIVAVLIMRDSVKSIRKELAQLKKELDSPVEEALYTPEEYAALEAQLRREILEELMQNAETENAGNLQRDGE